MWPDVIGFAGISRLGFWAWRVGSIADGCTGRKGQTPDPAAEARRDVVSKVAAPIADKMIVCGFIP